MACTPAQMAAFPGSLTNLIHLNLHATTGRKTTVVFEVEQVSQERQEQLVSALVCLQRLATSYPLETAQTQREALGALSQLTYLNLSYSSEPSEFEALPQLPELQQLVLADDYHSGGSASGVCPRTALCRRSGREGLLELAEGVTAEGVTAAECGITKLQLMYRQRLATEARMDSVLQHLPRLPKLQSLAVGDLEGIEGRYEHLAAVIERQADTLLSLRLQLDEPFEGPVFEQLGQQCTELQLMGSSASRRTLQLLGQAGELPRLQRSVRSLLRRFRRSWWAAATLRRTCSGCTSARGWSL
jgi:hypothetical protein